MSDKSAPEFIDTNILVYAHDQSSGEKHQVARDLIRGIWKTGNGCLSVQVLQEFYVTVTRKVSRPLPIEEAAEIVRDLSFWQVHSPTAEDVLGAIDIQRHYQVSFWDAMIVHAARVGGAEMLFTEVLHAGANWRGLTVVNPFQRG